MAKKKKRGFIARLLRALGCIVLAVVVLLAGMIGFLSLTEYKPADAETLQIERSATASLGIGTLFSVVTWNIGYGALGDNADFFMDGGAMVRTADEARMLENMQGILSEIRALSPDVLFVQETDLRSSRSYKFNEYAYLQSGLNGYCTAFAENFKVSFLPYPVPPIGKVDSGVATFSAYPMTKAERVQLPVPFAWPIRMANLKRCLLVSRVPVDGTDKELVLVNLHLEAYDDGEGKRAQTAMLSSLLQDEAAKGNYVIAGGDFNQMFSTTDASAYPTQPGNWEAGAIDVTQLGDGWQCLMDSAVPSCRSLYKPYADADKDTFQYYLLDGFIVSANVTVESFGTEDAGFRDADHNPVLLRAVLG